MIYKFNLSTWKLLTEKIISFIPSQCVGMLISVERTQKEIVDSDQGFLVTMLAQLHTKLVGMFEKYVVR